MQSEKKSITYLSDLCCQKEGWKDKAKAKWGAWGILFTRKNVSEKFILSRSNISMRSQTKLLSGASIILS